MFKMKKQKSHYAWFILAGCALMYFTTTGLGCNNFPVYSPFILKYYGYSKTKVSLISSFSSLTSTLVVLLTTKYYKVFSLKTGLLLSGFLMCLAYVTYGIADNYPLYLLGSVLRGTAYALGSMVPMSIMIDRWFLSKRTLALSIISAASGLATVGVPSVITWMIQHFGMRFSFLVSAAAFLLLYLISWLILRNDPSELDLTPYQDAADKNKGKRSESNGEDHTFRHLSEFWWTILSLSVMAGTSAVTSYANLSLLSSTEGFRPETVAIVVSVAGAGMTVGKLLFGSAATKLGLKKTSLIFGLSSVIGLLLCCLSSHGAALLFAGAGLLGLSLSAIIVGSVAWVQDWAQPEDRADHLKVFQSMYNLGSMVFGIMIGIIADFCGGSYVPFYAVAAVIAVYLVIIVQAAYRKQERRR